MLARRANICKSFTAAGQQSEDFRVEGIAAAGTGSGQATGICENGIFTGAVERGMSATENPDPPRCRIVNGGGGLGAVNVAVDGYTSTFVGRLVRLGGCNLTTKTTLPCDEQVSRGIVIAVGHQVRKSCGPVSVGDNKVTVHYSL